MTTPLVSTPTVYSVRESPSSGGIIIKMRRRAGVGLMLARHRKRWANIISTLQSIPKRPKFHWTVNLKLLPDRNKFHRKVGGQ